MSEAGAAVGYAVCLFIVYGLGLAKGRRRAPKARCSLCSRAIGGSDG